MAVLTGDCRMDLLVVLVALIAIGISAFKWALTYWARRGVPTPPATIPFGNAASVLQQKTQFGVHLQTIYREFKAKGLRYCGFYFLAKPSLLVFDLDLIRSIMSKDFQHFTDHAAHVNEKVDPLSGHLFSLKGLKWKNLRARLTPSFSSGKMKMMFQTLVDCSDNLLMVMDRVVEGNEAVDIKDTGARFTTDVIGSCAFGIDCNSLQNPNAEFRQYGKKIFEMGLVQAVKNLLSVSFPAVLDFFKIPLIKPDASDFFMRVVKETVSYREQNNIIKKDFMHLLIQLKNNVQIHEGEGVGNLNEPNQSGPQNNPEGMSLTIEQLAAQAFVFYIAEFETSSTTLTFLFYELVTNPEIQVKLRQEINDVLANHGEITYDALMDMTYMDKCINETLRKYPLVPLLNRVCTKTYRIPDSDLVLEKGAPVFLPILEIHHDPEYYPDPERFDPERFSPENKAKRRAFTWLPFGEGPRACISLRFGLMQIKVALAVLLKNYNFSLNPKTKTPIDLDPKTFVLTVKGGVWLMVEKIAK